MNRRSICILFSFTSGFLCLLTMACGGGNATPVPVQPAEQDLTSGYSKASFREASRATAVAVHDAIRSTQAGQFERDVKASLDASFRREGVTTLAFPHIVASGPNALELHYEGDGRQIQTGELLLLDIGGTSNGHCADLSRTFPVSPHFTARQKEIYQLVLDAQKGVAAVAQTGQQTLQDLDSWVRTFFRESSLRSLDEQGTQQTMDYFFIHGLDHYVGRQVHGEDTPWEDTSPIFPGQVFTLEPGLYLPAEGIGIRIEDTYLVKAAGLECMTGSCPKEVADLEQIRGSLALSQLGEEEKTAPIPAMEAPEKHMSFGAGSRR